MSDDPRFTYTRKYIDHHPFWRCDTCGALVDYKMQSDHTALHEGQDIAVSAVLWVQRKQLEEIREQQQTDSNPAGYRLTDPWRPDSQSHKSGGSA